MTSLVGPSRAVLRRSALAVSAATLAILVASCSSSPTTHADTSTSVTRSTASTSATTATTATTSPANPTETAILNAWQSALEALYTYLQGLGSRTGRIWSAVRPVPISGRSSRTTSSIRRSSRRTSSSSG